MLPGHMAGKDSQVVIKHPDIISKLWSAMPEAGQESWIATLPYNLEGALMGSVLPLETCVQVLSSIQVTLSQPS